MLLGSDGTLDALSLLRHGVSRTDVQEALLTPGLEEPAQARKVLLLPNGKIQVLKR